MPSQPLPRVALKLLMAGATSGRDSEAPKKEKGLGVVERAAHKKRRWPSPTSFAGRETLLGNHETDPPENRLAHANIALRKRDGACALTDKTPPKKVVAFASIVLRRGKRDLWIDKQDPPKNAPRMGTQGLGIHQTTYVGFANISLRRGRNGLWVDRRDTSKNRATPGQGRCKAPRSGCKTSL